MGRLALIILALLPAPALAHGGGLDESGGHHDRRTGEYHCHRAGCRAPQREQEEEARRREAEREDRPER